MNKRMKAPPPVGPCQKVQQWAVLLSLATVLSLQRNAYIEAAHAQQGVFKPCKEAGKEYCDSGNEDPALKANNVTLIPFNISNPICHQYVANGKYDQVGSQLSGRLSVYAYVRNQNFLHNHLRLQYVHAPLQWHPKTCCEFITDEYKKVDEMVNLGAGELSYFTLQNKVVCVAYNCDATEGRIGTARMWGPALMDLRRKYWSSPVEKPPLPLFKADHVNVVVHIRRGDVDARQKDRWTALELYLPWFKILKETLVDVHGFKLVIIIVSEGKVEDFDVLTGPYPELLFNLGDTRTASIHHFVCADILLPAKSTFSALPALYNDGIVLMQPWMGGIQPWWFKTSNLDELTANFKSNSTRQLLTNRLRSRFAAIDTAAVAVTK